MELTTTIDKLVKDFLKEICESEELRINMVSCANNSKIEVTIPGTGMKLMITEDDSEKKVESTEIVGKSLIQEIKEETMIKEVTDILREIGIPSHLLGYQYIREAILMMLENFGFANNVTKVLYPELAKKFETKPSGVERAMRHAIEVAWGRGNTEEIDKIFGYTVSYNKGKPTNTEFLAIVVDHIRLKYNMI